MIYRTILKLDMPSAIFSNSPLHTFSHYYTLVFKFKFQSSLLWTLLLRKILWKIDYISMIKRHVNKSVYFHIQKILFAVTLLLRITNFSSIRICWFCDCHGQIRNSPFFHGTLSLIKIIQAFLWQLPHYKVHYLPRQYFNCSFENWKLEWLKAG